MFSCRLFLCKLFLLLIFLYFLAHFLLDGNDLGWMPPSPDLSFVTDSPKKKHPDGPLVMKDGILDVGKTKNNKLVKAVLMESPMDEIIGINEGVNGGKRRKKLPISEQFLTVSGMILYFLYLKVSKNSSHGATNRRNTV
jgi:hypothetical protein